VYVAAGALGPIMWSVGRAQMDRHRRTVALSLASYLLFVCVPGFRTFIFGGLLRLLVLLVLAYLLMFVTMYSARVCSEIWACLQLVPAHRFVLSSKRHMITGWNGIILLRDEPFLSALFQRPPPIVSF
jgi:hypothetical protein